MLLYAKLSEMSSFTKVITIAGSSLAGEMLLIFIERFKQQDFSCHHLVLAVVEQLVVAD